MARLFLFLILLVAVICIAAVLYSIWTAVLQASLRHLNPVLGNTGGKEMGSNGIQKAAYVALIVILFGTASGWLGGM